MALGELPVVGAPTVKEFPKILVDNASTIQLALFCAVMISMWLLEQIGFCGSVRLKWRHTSTNALFILSALPIQIVMMLGNVVVSDSCARFHWGLFHLIPDRTSGFIKLTIEFMVLDLLDYTYHYSAHRFAMFWRFHLVHHTDGVVDVSTTVREHPGETLVRNGFLMSWVFLTGASPEILMLRQLTETVGNILSHTRFRLPSRAARALGWVFITPNLHHVHHHYQLPATNCNYGDIFSVWDRLFGTFLDLAEEDIVFGLDTHMDARATPNFAHILAIPFILRRATNPAAGQPFRGWRRTHWRHVLVARFPLLARLVRTGEAPVELDALRTTLAKARK